MKLKGPLVCESVRGNIWLVLDPGIPPDQAFRYESAICLNLITGEIRNMYSSLGSLLIHGWEIIEGKEHYLEYQRSL